MLKTVNESLKPAELKLIKEFGQNIAGFGSNFFVYDTELHIILHCDGAVFVSDFEAVGNYVQAVLASESKEELAFESDARMMAAKVNFSGGTVAVLVIDSDHIENEQSAFDVPVEIRQMDYLRLLLQIFVKNLELTFKSQQQIELVSNELAQTYEELMLLYKMSSSMKVTKSDSNYLQIACDNLTEIVNVEGIAVFLEKKLDDSKKLILTAGTGLIAVNHREDNMQEILYERLKAELQAGSDVLLDSEVDSSFKYDWFGRLKNIIAVPLHSNDKVIGMMVATNRIDKPDFDSIDSKLFNSVANECAVFIENNSLFNDLKELFIGSLKALTSSIDAKDQYTRGHSDRVAFISKWIAEHYAEENVLEQDEIQKIYLSGLLHDIGKIGIDESVLRKSGKLTDDEFNQIKTHPAIGAGILSDIKQMNDMVQGILCHHERYDGKGYPAGLSGDDIPLAGKIVMIADTFDAMTSKRTYREALSVQTAVNEIEQGIGGQFDPEIGRIFIQSDIDKLWRILQDGRIDNYYSDNFDDYGAVAIGALLR